jgi:hypothetical protein
VLQREEEEIERDVRNGLCSSVDVCSRKIFSIFNVKIDILFVTQYFYRHQY